MYINVGTILKVYQKKCLVSRKTHTEYLSPSFYSAIAMVNVKVYHIKV